MGVRRGCQRCGPVRRWCSCWNPHWPTSYVWLHSAACSCASRRGLRKKGLVGRSATQVHPLFSTSRHLVLISSTPPTPYTWTTSSFPLRVLQRRSCLASDARQRSCPRLSSDSASMSISPHYFGAGSQQVRRHIELELSSAIQLQSAHGDHVGLRVARAYKHLGSITTSGLLFCQRLDVGSPA